MCVCVCVTTRPLLLLLSRHAVPHLQACIASKAAWYMLWTDFAGIHTYVTILTTTVSLLYYTCVLHSISASCTRKLFLREVFFEVCTTTSLFDVGQSRDMECSSCHKDLRHAQHEPQQREGLGFMWGLGV